MDIALSPMDRKLIRLLEEDSRRSYTELAAILGVSRMTVKNRVDRLVDRGVIETFTIKLADTGPSGPTQPAATAFFHLKLKRPFCKTVYETIEAWPEVLGAWSIAGETDMTLLVSCASDGTLEELRDRLARHPEVQALSTAMVLRQWRHRTDGAPGTAQRIPAPDVLEKAEPRLQEEMS
uniref:Lrp/AsnC family transcriptional regulator n=1 Tax=Stappia sp. TaxID=1870903 RepID=UPI003BABBB8B